MYLILNWIICRVLKKTSSVSSFKRRHADNFNVNYSFVVETTFTLLPDLQALGAELKLAAEVVIVREEKFGVHKITGA